MCGRQGRQPHTCSLRPLRARLRARNEKEIPRYSFLKNSRKFLQMKISDDCQVMMDLYWACGQALNATTFACLIGFYNTYASGIAGLTYEDELDFVVRSMSPMELGAEALDGVNEILHRRHVSYI